MKPGPGAESGSAFPRIRAPTGQRVTSAFCYSAGRPPSSAPAGPGPAAETRGGATADASRDGDWDCPACGCASRARRLLSERLPARRTHAPPLRCPVLLLPACAGRSTSRGGWSATRATRRGREAGSPADRPPRRPPWTRRPASSPSPTTRLRALWCVGPPAGGAAAAFLARRSRLKM